MTSHLHKKPLAFVAGLIAVAALATSAVPVSATEVCPGGIKPPSPYCMNVLPVASTGAATNVTATSATLNGVAGPNVANGDSTSYRFQWGLSTLYGFVTPDVTLPSGPATSAAVATITNLVPGTTYHFRLVAFNSDGGAIGGDVTFTTAPKPIRFVHAPKRVKHGKTFKVRVRLRTRAKLTIALLRHGRTVKKFNEGNRSGTVTQKVRAPRKKGKYVIRVTAVAPGITQTVSKSLRVT
jgi:hypothetical protein